MSEEPKPLEQTEEQAKTKSYVIGTISLDEHGVFHAHYIGYHKVFKKEYFGNGVESRRNIRELLDVVGSRLNNNKDVYMEKIKEVQQNENTETSSDGSGDSST